MSSQPHSLDYHKISHQGLLRKALLGNAIFSGASGVLMAGASSRLAAFLELESGVVLAGLGAVLIVYAPFLVWLSFQKAIDRRLAWLVIGLDILWVIGSAVLVFSDLVPGLSVTGRWAIAIAADIVAGFAVLQYLGLRQVPGGEVD